MHTLLKTTLSVALLAVLLVNAVPAHAQFGSAGLQQTIALSQSPQTPQPNGQAVFRVNSFLFDIDTATIFWFVNDELRRSGVGVKEFTTTAGGLGQTTEVRVVVESQDGRIGEATRRLTPAAVALVWEADTYAPPLYRGHTPYTPGATISVLAVPTVVDTRGIRRSPQELIYTWSVDGRVLGSRSGRGRQSLTLSGADEPGGLRVSVDVATPAGDVSQSASVFIPESRARIVVYENSPLLGVRFNSAIRERFALTAQEATLDAYPLFFGVSSRTSALLQYRWRIGSRTAETTHPARLTVRAGEGPGTTNVSVRINNIRALLQSAEKAFAAVFGFQDTETPLTP